VTRISKKKAKSEAIDRRCVVIEWEASMLQFFIFVQLLTGILKIEDEVVAIDPICYKKAKSEARVYADAWMLSEPLQCCIFFFKAEAAKEFITK
jgi:hypothetical protein